MASTKAEVTVYIDGNDPAVIARMQELITENAELKTEIHTLTEERDTAEAKLTAIAAIERLPEDYTLHEWQHHAGFNDCLDIVHDIAEVNPAEATTPPASG